MFDSVLTVATNVATLFLIMGVGALCGRTGLLNDTSVKGCANLALYLATPCVILRSCMREFDLAMLRGFLIVIAAAFVNHLLLVLAAQLIFPGREDSRRRVLRYALVFSNAGYMALPLQQSLLGDDGVFYCAAYIIVFNVFQWTYGIAEMSGDRSQVSPKRLLLSPGILSVVVGLLLFFLPIPVPALARNAVGFLADLNTPLPMLIVGYYLGKTNLQQALRDRQSLLCIGLRLVGLPLLALGLLLLCGVRGDLLFSLMICITTPVATACTMFSARFDREPLLSVNLVSASTLLAVVTMPLLLSLTQFLGALV